MWLEKKRKEKWVTIKKKEITDILEEKKSDNFLAALSRILFGSSSTSSSGNTSKPAPAPERTSSYRPQDAELNDVFNDKTYFALFEPPCPWYFPAEKKSHFDTKKLLRTTKWNTLDDFGYSDYRSLVLQSSWNITTCSFMADKEGTFPLCLKDRFVPDLQQLSYNSQRMSWSPLFHVDDNGNFYITVAKRWIVSFQCFQNNLFSVSWPNPDDSSPIIFEPCSNATEQLLDKLLVQKNEWVTNVAIAQKLTNHIITTKKYPETVTFQWSHRENATSSNYVSNLDKLYLELDCYDSNTLFIWLCRKLWIPARAVHGYMSNKELEGKTYLGRSNGHMRSEIRDNQNNKRQRVDSTPNKQKDGSPSGQNLDDGTIHGHKDKENGSGTNFWSCPSPWQHRRDMEGKMNESSLLEQQKTVLDTLEKLKNAKSKEEIRDIMEKSGIQWDAKDELDEENNSEIERYNQEELDNLKKKIDKAVKDLDVELLGELGKQNTLDQKFKDELNDYKIHNERRFGSKMMEMRLNDMKEIWFEAHEKHLFDIRKSIVIEIEKSGMIETQKRGIKLAMPQYVVLKKDNTNLRPSGRLEMSWIISWTLTGDTRMFFGNKPSWNPYEKLNLVHMMAIDFSPDMGRIDQPGSPLREAVKAFYLESRKLEHFDVKLGLMIFDKRYGEVMEFGQRFNDKNPAKPFHVPAKLMRMLNRYSSGTDISGTIKTGITKIEQAMQKQWEKKIHTKGMITVFTNGIVNSGGDEEEIHKLSVRLRANDFHVQWVYIGNGNFYPGQSRKHVIDSMTKCFWGNTEDFIFTPTLAEYNRETFTNKQRRKIIKQYSQRK